MFSSRRLISGAQHGRIECADAMSINAVHSSRYKAVESSSYDTRAPERQSITMTRLNAAGQWLGGEAVEITLSNLRGCGPAETDSDGSSNQFCTSELYRQVAVLLESHSTQMHESMRLVTQSPSTVRLVRLAIKRHWL